MDRDAWFDQKCVAVHQTLGEKGRAIVGLVEPISSIVRARSAALIAYVCSRYTFPEFFEEIAGYLAASGLVSRWQGNKYVTAEMIRTEVVEPACEMYRRQELPFWCWWDPATILDCLQRRYLELGLKTFGESAMRAELWTWDQRDPEITNELLQAARSTYTRFDPWKLFKAAVDEECNETVEHIAGHADLHSLLSTFRLRHPEELSLREDLSEIAQTLNTLDIAQMILKQAATPTAIRVLSQIRKGRFAIATAAQPLTLLEHKMFMRDHEADMVLRRFVRSQHDLIQLDSMGAHSLPDRLASKSRIPDWLHNTVFARGGRLYHSSAGAIPSLIVVFEESDQIPTPSLGATPLQSEGDKAHFSLVINEPGKSALHARFSYVLSAADHLYDLILMLVVGWARIDFCRIAGREQLEHVTPCRISLPEEWLQSVRAIILPILKERFRSDPELFRQALMSGAMSFEAGAGILSCERAKSEQLILDFNEWVSTGSDGAAPSRHFVERKEELLLHDKRAHLLAQGRDADAQQVSDDIQAQRNIVLRARSSSGYSRVGVDSLTAIAATLQRSDRCLGHIAYESGHFDIFWLRYIDGAPLSGHIDVSRLDSRALVEAMSLWWSARSLETKQDALRKALQIVGEGVAAPLAKELGDSGVKHLVLCPTTLLELLPLHCAPTDGSAVLLDAFDHVTYVPSARVLAGLQSLGQITSERYTAITGSDQSRLVNALPEVEVLRRLFPLDQSASAPTTPVEALRRCKDANVIHFACHCDWRLNDFYGSGLRLQGGWLTCARILAEGDFRRAGLVVLAGCATGASTGSVDGLRGYAGLDAAFLARGARSTVATQ
jgi:hypothetical protein